MNVEFKSDLDRYLYKKRMSVKEFMGKTGLSRTAVYRYINGGKCNRSNAEFLEKMTEGYVSSKNIIGKQNNGKISRYKSKE